MPANQTSLDDFNAAVERRAYEKTRLPDVLKRKVQHLERKAGEGKENLREKQESTREKDLAEERAKQRLEHPTKTYEGLTMDGVRKPPSKEEIERLAVSAVDRRNALSLAEIDRQCEAKIDKVLALNREADPQDRTKDASDLLSKKNSVDIGRDFYRTGGPDRGS